MPEVAERPPKRVILTRAPNKPIDVKAAAQMRASGATWEHISQQLGGASGDAVRQAMARRGVNTAIRTTINKIANQQANESLAKQSEEIKSALSSTVLAQSKALSNIKSKPNLKNIKQIGAALEPLARTAKIVHGWGESSNKPLINLQVLGSVNFDTLPEQSDQPMIPVQSSVSSTVQDTTIPVSTTEPVPPDHI